MSKHDILVTLGNNNADRSANDLYCTPGWAVNSLLNEEEFNDDIWECCCGLGNISEVLKERGHNVYSTDLCDYGYNGLNEQFDFLTSTKKFKGDIITNPPYKNALQFVKHSIDSIENGNKVAMLLRIQFLEGIERGKFFKENPPKIVYVFSKRVGCYRPEIDPKNACSAMCFCWFIWEKGFKGSPIIKWL